MWVRWCTGHMKIKVTKKYLSKVGEYTLYIGIAADEPKRHINIPSNTVHPLYDWGITEAEALQYCYDKGFDWNGLYKNFRRVSCFCCPLQRISELRTLYKVYPELWKELKEMDDKVEYKFKPEYSISELEQWFKYEEENNLPPMRIKRKILNTL